MNSSSSPVELYEWILSKRDPRVLHLPLLSSPVPVLTMFVGYLLLVKQGPSLMLNKKGWDISQLVVVYNAALVLFSGYMFYEVSTLAYQAGFGFMCEVIDTSSSPIARKAIYTAWLYHFSKVIDILDTVFLIVRKKPVSYLHIYHHASVLVISWIGISFVPGGQAWFPVFINTFTHVVMYTYYCLSALGPNVRKYLWWKKYITHLQLVQFVIGLLHSFLNVLNTDCLFPKWWSQLCLCYSMSFILFFITPLNGQPERKKIMDYILNWQKSGANSSLNVVIAMATGFLDNVAQRAMSSTLAQFC